LLVTDILITDYSSTPFEFSLLKRPMVFFAYDIKDYKENQGLSQAYNEQMPGPIVYTTDDVIQAIQEEHINREFMNAFAEKWNVYSKGKSSQNVAKIIADQEHPALTEQVN